jgi:hypothetical protein
MTHDPFYAVLRAFVRGETTLQTSESRFRISSSRGSALLLAATD